MCRNSPAGNQSSRPLPCPRSLPAQTRRVPGRPKYPGRRPPNNARRASPRGSILASVDPDDLILTHVNVLVSSGTTEGAESQVTRHLLHLSDLWCPDRIRRDPAARQAPGDKTGARMVMTIAKITAGDGYTYLTRHTAHGDAEPPAPGPTRRPTTPPQGNPPGRWTGRGAPLLGLAGPGGDRGPDAGAVRSRRAPRRGPDHRRLPRERTCAPG